MGRPIQTKSYSVFNNNRSSNPEFDAIKLIKGWLESCEDRHPGICSHSRLSKEVEPKPRSRPLWLIDVEDQCVVPGKASYDYLALSYTWNSDEVGETFQLRSDNIAEFKIPGTLKEKEKELPRAILDAIDLTTALEKRYLWVDRLCIIQDMEEKQLEIDRMDQIYYGADATIVAAIGNVGKKPNKEKGLHYKSRGTSDSFIFQELSSNDSYPSPLDWSEVEESELFPSRIAWHHHHLSKSLWAKRGWTYQESLFSRRTIFFHPTSIFWFCERTFWDAYLTPPHEYDTDTVMTALPALGKPSLVQNISRFDLYADLVCPYNGRDLSRKEDGLNAFAGILNRLSSSTFPRGFYSGLPREDFDRALLWQPLHEDCSRRPSLPSWSWCGWHCYVDPKSLGSSSGATNLRKIVEWEHELPAQRNPESNISCVSPQNALSARRYLRISN
jgi:hypothetical protein